MENSTETKTKYVRYTKKQVNEMREALKTDTPRLVISKRFSNEWGVPTNAVYQKLNKVANTKRNYTKRKPKTTDVTTIKGTKEGVVITSSMINMLKKPTKVVMYEDHIRYYYN
jgi:hypothetical protein